MTLIPVKMDMVCHACHFQGSNVKAYRAKCQFCKETDNNKCKLLGNIKNGLTASKTNTQETPKDKPWCVSLHLLRLHRCDNLDSYRSIYDLSLGSKIPITDGFCDCSLSSVLISAMITQKISFIWVFYYLPHLIYFHFVRDPRDSNPITFPFSVARHLQ